MVFASGDRAKRGLKERGGLEFWNRGDKGEDDYPSPDSTKSVLEIYSDKLKNNPALLKQAVYGDLMHVIIYLYSCITKDLQSPYTGETHGVGR